MLSDYGAKFNWVLEGSKRKKKKKVIDGMSKNENETKRCRTMFSNSLREV